MYCIHCTLVPLVHVHVHVCHFVSLVCLYLLYVYFTCISLVHVHVCHLYPCTSHVSLVLVCHLYVTCIPCMLLVPLVQATSIMHECLLYMYMYVTCIICMSHTCISLVLVCHLCPLYVACTSCTWMSLVSLIIHL